jgi:hypothetical protein
MNGMITAWQNFWVDWMDSLSNPKAYGRLLAQSGWQFWCFVMASCVLLGLASWVQLSWRWQPQARQWAESQLNTLTQNYPESLVISWDGQRLTHTWPEIFRVPTPSSEAAASLPPYLITIMPTEPASASAISALTETSTVVLTDKTILVQDYQHQSLELTLAEVLTGVPTGNISKQNWPQVNAAVLKGWDQLWPIMMAFLAILWPFFTFLSVLIAALFDGVLAFLLLKLSNIKLSVAKIWQLSVRLTLVAQLAEFLVRLATPSLTWPVATVTYWVFFIIIMVAQRSSLGRHQSNP